MVLILFLIGYYVESFTYSLGGIVQNPLKHGSAALMVDGKGYFLFHGCSSLPFA